MPPLSLMIKPVSSLCNMRCRYCFYSDVSHRREQQSYGMMSVDTLETLVRRAFAYADDQISFAFQGGEPTLAGTAFYEALIRFQRKYNTRGLTVHNAIQTNGCDVTEDMIDLWAQEGFLVGVSLDGTREIHDGLRKDAHGQGTYDRARGTIKKLRKYGVDFNILCVVNKYVAREPRSVFEALREYEYIQFIPCIDDFDGAVCEESLTAEDYAAFLMKTFDLYYQSIVAGRYISIRNFDNYIGVMMGRMPENCAMQGRCGIYYLIEGDGSAYPCDFYVLDEWRMGNIRDDSFARLSKSAVGSAFRQASHFASPECSACVWRDLCRGGCRRDREPIGAEGLSLNRFCAAYRSFFEYAHERMWEISRRFAR